MKRLVAFLFVLALTLLPDVASAQDSIFDFPAGGRARHRTQFRANWGTLYGQSYNSGFGFQAAPGQSYTVQKYGWNNWSVTPYGPGWAYDRDSYERLQRTQAMQAERQARQNEEFWRHYWRIQND